MSEQMKIRTIEIYGKRITYSLLPGFTLGTGYKHQILKQIEQGMTTGMFTSKSTGNNIGYYLINKDVSQAHELKETRGIFSMRNIFTK